MPHVMLDLEALGAGNNAAIVAIGACRFDPYDQGGLIDKFYFTVDVEDAMKHGVAMGSTIKWWLKQSDAARRSTFPDSGTRSLFDALELFSDWIKQFGTSVQVWGNGATFDNVVIRSAYAAVKLPVPWSFRNDRCYRTLKELPGAAAAEFVRSGEAHNALDDAITQAIHMQKIYKVLGFPAPCQPTVAEVL